MPARPCPLLQHPNEIGQAWAPGMTRSAGLAVAGVGPWPLAARGEGQFLLTPQSGDRWRTSFPGSQVEYMR